MKNLMHVVTALVVLSVTIFASSVSVQPSGPEAQVSQAVQAFYTAFQRAERF